MFTGRPIDVIQSHLNALPEPPAARLGRPLPPQLESLVLACLEKDPSRRPESAQALADRLAACDDVEPWNAEEARRWWRGRKTAVRPQAPETKAATRPRSANIQG